LLDGQYSYIDSTYNTYAHATTSFQGVYDNFRASPVVGDVAGDGGFEMLLGTVRGGVELYKWKTPPVSVAQVNSSEAGKILVYPNPTGSELNVSWSGVPAEDVHISFINMAGQQSFYTTMPASATHTTISVSSLPVGMYVCVLQSGVSRYYSKFTVIH
jgi:hypothetical protein